MTITHPDFPAQPAQAGAEPTADPMPQPAAPGPNTPAGQGTLTIHAVGTPAPAGSKRAFVVNGRARMVESSKKVRPWWQAIAGAAQDALPADWETLTGPVCVHISFYLARPGYHYRTGAHAGELKPAAPTHCDKKPDTDKLERTVLDALKAVGIYRDDAQVAELHAVKLYANASTGARITIGPLDSVSAASRVPAGADTDPARCPASVEDTGHRANTNPEGALF